jgi:hypothetical protein
MKSHPRLTLQHVHHKCLNTPSVEIFNLFSLSLRKRAG